MNPSLFPVPLLNPALLPLIQMMPRMAPRLIHAHWMTPEEPSVLLILLLAAHDIDFDFESMARLSRQQADYHVWMFDGKQVAHGLQQYVHFARELREFLRVRTQLSLDRQRACRPSPPPPSPLPSIRPQSKPSSLPYSPIPSFIEPPEFVNSPFRKLRESEVSGVGEGFTRGGQGNGAVNMQHNWGVDWEGIVRVIDQWRQTITTNDSGQDISRQYPLAIENHPLGIVESIEGDDSQPRNGPPSGNNRMSQLERPRPEDLIPLLTSPPHGPSWAANLAARLEALCIPETETDKSESRENAE